jgi:hypothetical protein
MGSRALEAFIEDALDEIRRKVQTGPAPAAEHTPA